MEHDTFSEGWYSTFLDPIPEEHTDAEVALIELIPVDGDQDLIARKIGDMTGHLYASEHYLQQIGVPRSAEDLGDANIICDK